MRKHRRKIVLDYPLLGVVLGLVLIGFTCIFSATLGEDGTVMSTNFGKQVVWFIFGMAVFMSILFCPLNVFFRGAYLFYGISIGLLLLVLFIGKGSAHRWIDLGFVGFQPSELAKVATLLVLARVFPQEKGFVLEWKRLLGGVGLVALPVLLILKEPDVGTALVFVALLVTMVYWAGIERKWMLFVLAPLVALVSGFWFWLFVGVMVVLGVGLAVSKPKWWVGLGVWVCCLGTGLLAPTVWSKLEPYQRQRLLIFLGVKSDPHGAAYQVIQSKVAIGSGGIAGKGFLQGSQTQLRFLPEQHTDFIFSVLGEEFGFMGGVVVLGMFLFFLWRILRIAKTSHNRFASYLGVGSLSIIAFQVVVNVGMVVGLLPVTGLPLPFLSYGGSSLLMALSLVGFATNVSGRRYT